MKLANSPLRGLIVAAFCIGCFLELLCWIRVGAVLNVAVVFFVIWGLSPYLVLFATPRLSKSHAEAVAVIVITVLGDALLRVGFLLSKSSTAPIALMFIPFYVLILCISVSLATRFFIWLRRSRVAKGA